MTNFEKYIDDFIFASAENDLCAGFIEPVILNPKFIYCQNTKCEDCRKMVKDFFKEEYKGAPVDWSKVQVDTPILVCDNEEDGWIEAHFAKCENDMVYAWDDGRTSYTSRKSDCSYFEHAKLVEDEKK